MLSGFFMPLIIHNVRLISYVINCYMRLLVIVDTLDPQIFNRLLATLRKLIIRYQSLHF